jgi:hypothetical protein
MLDRWFAAFWGFELGKSIPLPLRGISCSTCFVILDYAPIRVRIQKLYWKWFLIRLVSECSSAAPSRDLTSLHSPPATGPSTTWPYRTPEPLCSTSPLTPPLAHRHSQRITRADTFGPIIAAVLVVLHLLALPPATSLELPVATHLIFATAFARDFREHSNVLVLCSTVKLSLTPSRSKRREEEQRLSYIATRFIVALAQQATHERLTGFR